jgi:AbrB family looped-hinge helix DNA binding protein
MGQQDKNRPDFFSITTIGERGQVVIPKDARQALGLGAGDKLVVLPSKRGNGILLMRQEDIKQIARQVSERADRISRKSRWLQEKLHDTEQAD